MIVFPRFNCKNTRFIKKTRKNLQKIASMGTNPSFFQCQKPSKTLFNPKIAKTSLLQLKNSAKSSFSDAFSQKTSNSSAISQENPKEVFKPLENFVIEKKLKENCDSVLLMRKKSLKISQLFVLKTAKLNDFQDPSLSNYQQFLKNLPRNPFIAEIVQVFALEASLYIIMEHCAGGRFCDLLKKQRRFSEDIARFYAAELLLALETLDSSANFRGFSFENVLLDSQGHVKVADFGAPAAGACEKNTFLNNLCRAVHCMVAGKNCSFEEKKLPRFLSQECRDFIEKIEGREWRRVKEHAFFRGFPWKMAAEKKIPAPFCAGKSAKSLMKDKNFGRFWKINEEFVEKPAVYLERTYFVFAEK